MFNPINTQGQKHGRCCKVDKGIDWHGRCSKNILYQFMLPRSQRNISLLQIPFATVYFVNRFLFQNFIEGQKLQMFGVTCMLISSLETLARLKNVNALSVYGGASNATSSMAQWCFYCSIWSFAFS